MIILICACMFFSVVQKKGKQEWHCVTSHKVFRHLSGQLHFSKKIAKTLDMFLLVVFFFPSVISWNPLHQKTLYHKRANRWAWNRPSSQIDLRLVGLQIPLHMLFHQQMVLMLFGQNSFHHKTCPCFRKAVSGQGTVVQTS